VHAPDAQTITFPLFARLLRALNDFAASGQYAKEAYAKVLFSLLDSDGSGVLDEEEFLSLCDFLYAEFWVGRKDSDLLKSLRKNIKVS
jgi:hypothetical protein